jgi:hypothetical protein
LTAQATDDGGRTGTAQVAVNVQEALTLAIDAPVDGSDVVGLVEIRPEIAAARQIRQVTMSVDGAVIATLTASPYTFLWDTAPLPLGPHTLTVSVEDDHGATAQAQAQVTVVPALTLSLTSPADGATVVGVVDVQPDIQAVRKLDQVLVSVDATPVATVPAPPYTYRWDTAELDPGPHQVQVRAQDDQGATAQAQAQVDVLPVLTATWVSPQPGAEMTATVTLVARAQAHYGVERVEFYANDQLLGGVKTPPFEIQWSTLNLEEPLYRMSACAYDVLGHEDCSGVTLELKRPGPGVGMFIALGFLLVAIVLVTAMVVRTRQRQAAVRRPTPVVPSAPPPAPARPAPLAPEPMAARETPTDAYQPLVPPAEGPRAFLVVQPAEGRPTREVNLPSGETTIGRGTESDIRIDDELASRRHASVRFREDAGGYIYRDLSPTNPSIINDQEYRQPHLLRPGDTIVVGTTVLVFSIGS